MRPAHLWVEELCPLSSRSPSASGPTRSFSACRICGSWWEPGSLLSLAQPLAQPSLSWFAGGGSEVPADHRQRREAGVRSQGAQVTKCQAVAHLSCLVTCGMLQVCLGSSALDRPGAWAAAGVRHFANHDFVWERRHHQQALGIRRQLGVLHGLGFEFHFVAVGFLFCFVVST